MSSVILTYRFEASRELFWDGACNFELRSAGESDTRASIPLSKLPKHTSRGTFKAISHQQKFANPTLNSTVRSTQNSRIEFNLQSDMEVGVEENTLNPVDFKRQS
ncbi:hypothetical protein AVEN_260771-1 [Araneus ventricosus]|uniref:Uncharacterized protein n=1 Tax=Araneus ventricosus TaxID=182803 RepID=A0A4Y2UFS6_ARAVE|nr:hypothetical protein AVEN_160395-1 [Araneus ventricosus]GBO10024.1 hypothetical protein AVEN_225033-1 [Araneus ventricosus]GBO10953.1 hypothetical protein AVEN_3667-1 [Araneus ventricosus]GBO10954.1 hypothetical protein AVEN_260771-1 [Araneus ventricosus]